MNEPQIRRGDATMTNPPEDTTQSLGGLYWLLGCLAVGLVIAKILGAELLFEPSRFQPPTSQSYGADRDPAAIPKRVWPATRPEPTPMFGSNDRSRWATVRALVEDGTYVVGQRHNFQATQGYQDSGIIFQDGYQSLDKVMQPETGLFYSSKPPLFATLLAGPYWCLHHGLGWSIDRDRWWVVGTILLFVNAFPFAIYLAALRWWLARVPVGECVRLAVFLFAALGTFLTTFSMTLNNHTPAACAVMLAVCLGFRGVEVSRGGLLWGAGFCAGLAAAFELPALSFTAGLAAWVAWWSGRQVGWFLLGVLLPGIAFFTTNYWAIGQFLPAYGEFGGPWYDFAGSQWAKLKDPVLRRTIGIDGADEPKWLYAWHLTLGHHGWFSLTPVWGWALAGLVAFSGKALLGVVRDRRHPALREASFFLMVLLVSLVVFGFYVVRTNNYGGFCSCARWLLWLTPLWTLALPTTWTHWCGPAARTWRQILLGLAFLLSTFAVYYPAANPWRAPWILQLCELQGWVRY